MFRLRKGVKGEEMNKKKSELQNTLDNLIEIFGAIFSEACTFKKIQVNMKKKLDEETKEISNSLYILNVFQAE